MFAATAYKLLKLLTSENGMQVLQDNLLTLIVGNVVAFIVALLAIKFFISFVTKYGFKAFGYYRIIVGGIIIVLMLLGYNLKLSRRKRNSEKIEKNRKAGWQDGF